MKVAHLNARSACDDKKADQIKNLITDDGVPGVPLQYQLPVYAAGHRLQTSTQERIPKHSLIHRGIQQPAG